MIAGNGDIAGVLKDRDDFIFFASGVSNSKETRDSEFVREINLLFEQNRRKHLVYFSSLSIFYSKTSYSQHKKSMEWLVKKNFDRYTIVRLGNIAWGVNKNTLINFFRNQVDRGEPLDIQDTHRYVVEKEEFLHWMGLIPEWNCEMNITGQYLSIKEIVNKYVYIGLKNTTNK